MRTRALLTTATLTLIAAGAFPHDGAATPAAVVQAAQDDLNQLPGNLKIAIADNGSCENLREPEASELSGIIKAPPVRAGIRPSSWRCTRPMICLKFRPRTGGIVK